MTECVYAEPVASFRAGAVAPAPSFTVPVLAHGRAALERANADMGLGFDQQVPPPPAAAHVALPPPPLSPAHAGE